MNGLTWRSPPLWQLQIPATESKRQYLNLMEEMHERRARQLKAREFDIRIKEMHAHMRGTELKEEEELREREEALKKREELVICEREFQKQNKKFHTSFNCTQ
jgi:hypothetical protein